MYSPIPINVIRNEMHYVLMNLHMLDNTKQTINTQVVSRFGSCNNVYFEYSPWEDLQCPDEQGKCPIGVLSGQSWTCWNDETNERVCYPYAEKRYDAWLEAATESLDDGVVLTYNSRCDADLCIQISCDKNYEENSITIDNNQQIAYSASNKEFMTLFGISAAACPT